MSGDFSDLLAANAEYARRYTTGGRAATAQSGVAIVTCMDARILPLETFGLGFGDAKVLRTPGGRVTPDVVTGCVLGAALLGINRILVMPHTRCAVSSGSDPREKLAGIAGALSLQLSPPADQLSALRSDVETLRHQPGLEECQIGGFRIDIDTGVVTEIC